MHVFLETNFVLELAFRQREVSFCERIWEQVRVGSPRYRLSVPQYAFSEAFQQLRPLKIKRDKYEKDLLDEVRQHLREDESDAEAMDTFGQTLTTLLAERTRTQTRRLYEVVAALMRDAPGPALTPASVLEAQELVGRHGLPVQDALIYASVLAGLRELPNDATKLFVSRNKKDFGKTAIVEELASLNCEYVAGFQAAAGKLRV